MSLIDIKCPNCGASIQLDNSRESGFCSYCGSKVQIQEAINKIKIDRSCDINNYLHLAKTASEANNGQETYDYANKVLELDSTNAEAWELKMVGIALMPGFNYYEIITAGNKAIEFDSSLELRKRIYMSFLSICSLYFQNACMMLLEDLQTLKVLYDSHCTLDPDNATNNMLNEDSTKDYLINEISQMLTLRFAVPDEEIGQDEDFAEITVEIAKGWIECEQAVNSRYNTYGTYLSDEALNYWKRELEKIKKGLPTKYLTNDINPNRFSTRIENNAPKKQKVVANNEGGCYIATAVYGSYDAPEVMVLRQFRDNSLNKTFLGKCFIKAYYYLSPPVAKKLKNAKRINKLVRFILDKWVKHLQQAFINELYV